MLYSTTAISITHLKEALVYFDHVIPVNLVMEAVREGWRAQIPAEKFDLQAFLPPRTFLSEMLPPELNTNAWFRERLSKANVATRDLFIKMHQVTGDEIKIAEAVANWMIYRVIDEFGLGDVPVVIMPDLVTSVRKEEESDIAVSLLSLKVVDVENASWEQLYEFRRDPDARGKLRRLRLFAYENYAGKPKQFIIDDILNRIADHDEAVRKWGFETKSGIVSSLLSSRVLQTGLGISTLSALLQEPVAAIFSGAAPLVLELSRIALDFRKQRFAFRTVMKNNPVSYLVDAKERLSSNQSS